MLSLDDLLTPVTPEQAESNILSIAAQLGLPVTAWQSGGVARTLVKVVSRVYSAFTQVAVLGIQGGFLDYATGNWMTLLAKNVYNVDRITATFATAAQGITLTNTGGGLFVIEPGDLTFSRVNSAGEKKLYRNTSGGTLQPWSGSGSYPTLTLDVQALEVGTASNASPGQINVLETTLLGVTCANNISVLGQDEETDEQLRQRCKESLGALSPNGPKDAYEYVAKSAVRTDGSSIGITRVKIPTPPGDGSLKVYVATKNGPVSGDLNQPQQDPPTDLWIVNNEIQSKVVPEGVGPVTVASAVAVPISITATVYVDKSANLSTNEVTGAIYQALDDYFKTVPIGGYVIPPAQSGSVFHNAVLAQIENAMMGIINAELTAPAGDVPMAEEHVPVLNLIGSDVAVVPPVLVLVRLEHRAGLSWTRSRSLEPLATRSEGDWRNELARRATLRHQDRRLRRLDPAAAPRDRVRRPRGAGRRRRRERADDGDDQRLIGPVPDPHRGDGRRAIHLERGLHRHRRARVRSFRFRHPERRARAIDRLPRDPRGGQRRRDGRAPALQPRRAGTSGWAIVMPRAGTFDATHIVIGDVSGASMTPTATATFTREVVFWKSPTNAYDGSVYYVCANQSVESGSLFSTLAASANCTATVAPGGSATAGNQFPAIAICCRGTAAVPGGAVASHAPWFHGTSAFGRGQVCAVNATPSAGTSADGTFWAVLYYTGGTTFYGFGFFRLDDTEPGDVDPFAWFYHSSQAQSPVSTSRTTATGAGNYGNAPLSYGHFHGGTGNVAWRGYCARGAGGSKDSFVPLIGGATACNNVTTPLLTINAADTMRLANHPDSPGPVVQEPMTIAANMTGLELRKGTTRWLTLMPIGAALDTFDNRSWLVVVGAALGTSPAVAFGPYDGVTTPAPT